MQDIRVLEVVTPAILGKLMEHLTYLVDVTKVGENCHGHKVWEARKRFA